MFCDCRSAALPSCCLEACVNTWAVADVQGDTVEFILSEPLSRPQNLSWFDPLVRLHHI